MRKGFRLTGVKIVSAILIATPLVFLLFLGAANRAQMALQADEISTLASAFRNYYADNVISRIQAADGVAKPSEKYRQINGGIPLPATLSIEMGPLFDSVHRDGRIAYQFRSDYPFLQRARAPLNEEEEDALTRFRQDPTLDQLANFNSGLVESFFGGGKFSVTSPIRMKQSCVECHNSHPDSPKKDWRVGDVRGIQKVEVAGVRTEGFGNIGLMFLYVCLSAGTALVFLVQKSREARNYKAELGANSKLLELGKQQIAAVEAVSARRKLFEATLEGSKVAIAIADMKQKDRPMIYVNKAFCDLTGYQKDDCLGRSCRFLQGPATEPEEIEKIRKALDSGQTYSGKITNYTASGEVFLNELKLIPIYIDGENTPSYYFSNQALANHIDK